MKEIIEKITEKDDGYTITTNKQLIQLEMGEGGCCAVSGYYFTPEDTKEFIGAELIDIKLVDTPLIDSEMDYNEGGVVFVNLETSKGVLQFTAYNRHDGYYSATGRVISRQLSDEWTV